MRRLAWGLGVWYPFAAMGVSLDQIVPWGRSYDEYVAMFDLRAAELDRRLLGCADGPAAFNGELTARGGSIVSVDPLYRFDAGQIARRIAETSATVLDQVRRNAGDYVWEAIPSVEALGAVRMAAMRRFLADFEAGRRAGRYVTAALPALPFASGQFDIALVSHFLFLYSVQLSAAFHVQALRELLRVAREVRVFPVLTIDGLRSPHLGEVTDGLTGEGLRVELRRVAYEFQRGANQILVVSPA
jgi:hypothetical protein